MNQITESMVAKRKAKFLLIAPLLILPFLGILFWALGGGQEKQTEMPVKDNTGLNSTLPKAQLKPENWDKLKFYEQAQQDSAKRREMAQRDPYSNIKEWIHSADTLDPNSSRFGFNQGPESNNGYKDANEVKVYQKIAEINAAIDKDVQSIPIEKKALKVDRRAESIHSESVDRLENMMKLMKEDSGVDKDIQQLNGIVSNFMDLQYPERMQERLKIESVKNQGKVYPIHLPEQESITVLGGSGKEHSFGAFFSDGTIENYLQETMLPCTVDESQSVANNSTIKIKILRGFVVNGYKIPAGFEVTGKVSFSSNRVMITVSSIITQNIFIPVSLKAIASDGLEGLPVKGNLVSDLAKQSADQAMQSFNIGTMSGSLGAEAVSAGIEATKSLVKRKTKPVFVSISAGYSLFLMDQQNK